VADDAVSYEPVSATNSLLTGKLTGNFLNPVVRCDFDVQSASEFNGFQPNSLRDGTANFQTGIRELFRRTGFLVRVHLLHDCFSIATLQILLDHDSVGRGSADGQAQYK
jgi:hypothetical protein